MVVTIKFNSFVLFLILNSFPGITLSQHTGLSNVIREALVTSDPISADVIKGYLPSVKYNFYNTTFTGLKNGAVKNVQINEEDKIISFNLESPQIEMLGSYKLRGKVGGFSLTGEGPVHVLIDDYMMVFECDYENIKGHVYIANYLIEATPRSKTVLDFQNLTAGDKEKTQAFRKYFKENMVRLEMELRSPALNTFMDTLMENVNKILATVPAGEILA